MGRLDVEMVGEPLMTLQEFDGIMGQIQIRYQVAINEEDGTRSWLTRKIIYHEVE